MQLVTEPIQRSHFGDPANASREENPRLATFRDRFAALVLDLVACSILAWAAIVLLNARSHNARALFDRIKVDGAVILAVLGVTGACVLLYFFVLEWTAGASIGKLVCGLEVRTVEHARCGMVSALVRTVFRPFDVVAGPILILLSARAQRLGDRVAGTVVSWRETKRPSDRRDECLFATWEERARAAIVDLALLILFVVAYLFATGALSAQIRGTVHPSIVVLVPLVQLLFLYFVVFEGLLGGTVGKLVCGLKVVTLAEGQPGFIFATLRVLVYPLNCGSLGLFPLILLRVTKNRQHLGDLLAGSCVITAPARPQVRIWATAAALSTVALIAMSALARQAASRLLAG